jgi:bacillithiol synthase
MPCSCVPHTQFPHTSRFFADLLYEPHRAGRFFPHTGGDLASFRAAANEALRSARERGPLIEALRMQNPPGGSLEKLARPDTVAVVTGQQVGLFSGPSYTIYKALHAAKLAAWLTANGIPAVPVFWLATEDHDFAEVSHVWVFDAGHRPVKLEMRRSASAQPVGTVTLADPPVRELREAFAGLPFADETAALVERAYRPGASMGDAFGALLRELLERYDILQVDPMLPQFRELAAPAVRAAVEAAPELNADLLARNRELVDAGYHAQVHVEEQTSLVFLLENGKRLTLRRHGGEYVLNGRRFTGAELAGLAASLSPNALLRPVVQDSILPTVAYIGGPAEMAYFAQSEVIYRRLLGRMPVPVPRAGFTLLDAHSRKLMDRYAISLADFFHGEEAMREQIARKLVPPALGHALAEAKADVDETLERLGGVLAGFDPTLAASLERSGRKIRYQLAKIERKTGRETLRRDARAAQDAQALYNLVYPERTLQERIYSMLPFIAKHGPEIVEGIYDAIELDCPDHRMMVI